MANKFEVREIFEELGKDKSHEFGKPKMAEMGSRLKHMKHLFRTGIPASLKKLKNLKNLKGPDSLKGLRQFTQRHQSLLLASFAIFIITVAGGAGICNHYLGYSYSYNGQYLGIVKNKEDVLKITGLVQRALTEENSVQVNLDQDKDITFHRVSLVGKPQVDNSEEVLQRLTYVGDVNVKAYSITVNGKHAAIVANKQTADSVLTSLKQEYIKPSKNTVVEKSNFVQDVQIKPVNADLQNLQKADTAKQILQTGAVVERTYVVKPDQTLADLAKASNTTEDAIIKLNPGIDPKKPEAGAEVKVEEQAPLVTLNTQELVTYNEKIPFQVIEKKSDKLYKGDQKIETKGVEGIKVITARVEKQNGEEYSNSPLVEKVESEPSTQVVLVGTQKRPPTIGDGHFIWPVPYHAISSPFGPRWGSFHEGIDLPCPVGTPVKAGDGGTVYFAGYQGARGNVVMIDHQNGMTSYYEHNSVLLVKAGDKVYKGQEIALSGSTGHSTGPHCHFQINVNGTPVNPVPYLPKP